MVFSDEKTKTKTNTEFKIEKKLKTTKKVTSEEKEKENENSPKASSSSDYGESEVEIEQDVEIDMPTKTMVPRNEIKSTTKKDKKKDKIFEIDELYMKYLNNIKNNLLSCDEEVKNIPTPTKIDFILVQLKELITELENKKLSSKYDKCITTLIDHANTLTKYLNNKGLLTSEHIKQIFANLLYANKNNNNDEIKFENGFTASPNLIQHVDFPIKFLKKIVLNKNLVDESHPMIAKDLAELQIISIIIYCDSLIRKDAFDSLNDDEKNSTDFKSINAFDSKRNAFNKIIEEIIGKKKGNKKTK